MLNNISYYMIFGKPFIFWGGATALLFILLAVLAPVLNKKGIKLIPMKYHQTLGLIGAIIGLVHGLLAILFYL